MQRTRDENNSSERGGWKRTRIAGGTSTEADRAPPEIIVISDDEEEEMPPPQPAAVAQPIQEDPAEPDDTETNVWFFVDPVGHLQGPLSILSLKIWWDAGFFPPTLTVYLGGIYAYNLTVLLSAYFPEN